ncbi:MULTISPECIES: phosphatase PAP2 family protein [unclassified Nocardioides]|uniref:phosphatase PAP2 family protein n=1 Tax=unclassified Nocardioides TaxID=2615069 RepID=UPI0000EB6146|nr:MULTISPECIES: phosphatase PAP2 family protein [unclassified Nocardioides]ABL81067.1 Undecaprenyl-diphosphatase [Nocardioides sp. JS614]
MSTSAGSVVWGSAQEAWFDAVNHLARVTPWLHTPARLYAEYGVELFAGLLLVSWWLARRDGDLRRVAATLWAPVGALVALGVNQPLASAVAEPRPYMVLPHAMILVSRSSDYSFPSDHAVMAGAVAAGVLLAHRRLGLVTAALAVLMAFTRVYVGAHFPLDVAAGLVVGAVVAVVSFLLARSLIVRLVELLARTPARALLTTGSRAT